MKQIILIGDLNRWLAEATFLTEMLHLSAARVITVNIGRLAAPADLNAREIRQLFPGKPLAECVHLSVAKLYAQGLVDGILGLLGKEPHLFASADRAFAAVPFGYPKVAVLRGDCPWQGRKDILRIYLPGTAYTMNPVIKIVLGNTAFAVSGMSLCSIHNFGSPRPTVGIIGIRADLSKYFASAGLNYISFAEDDQLLSTLLCNGYIQGLMLAGKIEGNRSHIDVAAAREIPVVIASREPEGIRAQLDFLPAASGPITVICSHPPESQGLLGTGKENVPPLWLRCHSISHKFGSEGFYQYAVRALAGQIF